MTRLSACCISRELESYSPHRGPLGPADDGCGCSSGVEHNLAKVGVEGSNPFARSKSALYYPEPSTFFRSAVGRRPERIDTKILGSNPFSRSKSVHFLALSANRTLLIENFLHENEIEPAVEFPADLLQPSRFRKAQFAMKVD